MRYGIEIVNPAGDLIADLSGRARARRITMSRNEAEDIQFEVDLADFEKYCRDGGLNPNNVMALLQNEVRIKRGENYLCGGQLIYHEPIIDNQRATLQVRATGFLNLFMDRFTGDERVFEGVEATEIFQTLIEETQALPNGDFGITIGTMQTVGLQDWVYRRTNLKDAFQDLTKSQVAGFDMEFTYDKVANAYARLGSNRPEIIFEYPGNIRSVNVPTDATGLANQIILLGSGIGNEALTLEVQEDLDSQLNYSLRQKVVLINSIVEDSVITDKGMSELSAWSNPFQIPGIVVDGNGAPFLGSYRLGDSVKVRLSGFEMINHIDEMYRIEKIDINITDEDDEQITLYLNR